MFNSKVFKKGDRVLLKEDLSQEFIIQNLYTESRSGFYDSIIDDEKVVLNNDKVYDLSKIVPYTYQVKQLAIENKELRAMIVKNMEQFNQLEKKINEKVFKPEQSYWGSFYGVSILPYITGMIPEVKKELTLEERIANLEAKKEKKTIKKKNKKSKK